MIEFEDRDEVKNDVASLIHSNEWRLVVKPLLQKRCEDIQRKLAVDFRLTLEDIRALQTKYSVLIEILESPLRFFLGEDG